MNIIMVLTIALTGILLSNPLTSSAQESNRQGYSRGQINVHSQSEYDAGRADKSAGPKGSYKQEESPLSFGNGTGAGSHGGTGAGCGNGTGAGSHGGTGAGSSGGGAHSPIQGGLRKHTNN